VYVDQLARPRIHEPRRQHAHESRKRDQLNARRLQLRIDSALERLPVLAMDL